MWQSKLQKYLLVPSVSPEGCLRATKDWQKIFCTKRAQRNRADCSVKGAKPLLEAKGCYQEQTGHQNHSHPACPPPETDLVSTHPRAEIQWVWAVCKQQPRDSPRSPDTCWSTELSCCASHCPQGGSAWCNPAELSSASRSGQMKENPIMIWRAFVLFAF